MILRLIPWLFITLALSLPLRALAIKHNPIREATGHVEAVLVTAQNTRTHKTLHGAGVLIAPRAVLTAAHCAADFDSWIVIAPVAKSRRVRVREARVHPKYQPGLKEQDLAILILEEPIDTRIPLPNLRGSDLLPIETKLTIVGRVANGKVSGDRLFQASVTLVADRSNANVYGGIPQVCEHGDSGGPVYVAGKPNEIVAVVGGVLEESRANVPTDIFVPITRASREWILRQAPKEP
jgi:secreted trypsin-like serine protease